MAAIRAGVQGAYLVDRPTYQHDQTCPLSFDGRLRRAAARILARDRRVRWWPNVPLAILTVGWHRVAYMATSGILTAALIALPSTTGSHQLGTSNDGPVAGLSPRTEFVDVRAMDAGLMVEAPETATARSAPEQTSAESQGPGVPPSIDPASIPTLVRRAAIEEGADPELALAIAWCESRFDPRAFNPRARDSGLFQFIPSTWAANSVRAGLAGADVFDPEANARTASWMLARGQAYQAWGASSACWSQSP